MDKLPDLKEVKITCTIKDCANDHHLYRPKRGEWGELDDEPECQGCGDKSVDMSVTRARDISKPEAIFAELGREFIRYIFLNRDIDARARRLILKYQMSGIRDRVASRIKTAIGRSPDVFDGRQTPLTGNILHYAQHATATCCRKCAWYWYGIPREGPLSTENLAFCEGLIHAYLDKREGEILAIAASPPLDGGDEDDDE